MPAATSPAPSLHIACLCAAWCRLCEGYRPTFEAVVQRLQARWPQLQAHWVDIEDQAELVGDLDIETFPTVLVTRGGAVLFAGSLTPQADTLQRVAAAALARAAPVQAGAAYEALARALQRVGG